MKAEVIGQVRTAQVVVKEVAAIYGFSCAVRGGGTPPMRAAAKPDSTFLPLGSAL
jgi:hypothetical protein